MWYMNYQHLVSKLKLTKNKFKIFTNRIMRIHSLSIIHL